MVQSCSFSTRLHLRDPIFIALKRTDIAINKLLYNLVFESIIRLLVQIQPGWRSRSRNRLKRVSRTWGWLWGQLAGAAPHKPSNSSTQTRSTPLGLSRPRTSWHSPRTLKLAYDSSPPPSAPTSASNRTSSVCGTTGSTRCGEIVWSLNIPV